MKGCLSPWKCLRGGFLDLLGGQAELDAAATSGLSELAASSRRQQPPATSAGGFAPQQEQPASPAASSGSQPAAAQPAAAQPAAAQPAAAGHAQREGHFALLTVGGQQPVAGQGQYQGKSLVVLGDAEVSGELWSRGALITSGGWAVQAAGQSGSGKTAQQG